MRSRLEADYARWLDQKGYDWQYEPQCFASENGQYLPDFLVEDRTGEQEYVEVKPLTGSPAQPYKNFREVDPLLERMTIIWASKPNAALSLFLWQFGDDILSSCHIRWVPAVALWLATLPGSKVSMIWPGMGQSESLQKVWSGK